MEMGRSLLALGSFAWLFSCSAPPAISGGEGTPPSTTSAGSGHAPLSTPASSPSVPPAPSSSAPPATSSSAPPATSATPPAEVVDARGCIQDPLTHAIRHVLSHHAAQIQERLGEPPTEASLRGKASCLSRQELPDVDGDGKPEIVIAEGCSWGAYAALQMLYLSNKECSKFAGSILDGELTLKETRGAGVRDLEATWSSGCAGNDFAWTHYRWDGKGYRAIDKATCHLCTDAGAAPRPPKANQHPHCKAEARSRSKPR